jgi:pyrrolidone-carboxylate peptidase
MPPKPKILITAFEPFDGRNHNVSKDTIALLGSHPEAQIITLILPVNKDAADRRLRQAIEFYRPDYVIGTGESGIYGGFGMDIETVARGRDANTSAERSIPENDASFHHILQHAYARDIYLSDNEIRLSSNAGDGACGHTFYSASRFMGDIGKPNRTYFIHLRYPNPERPASLLYEHTLHGYAEVLDRGIDYLVARERARGLLHGVSISTVDTVTPPTIREVARARGGYFSPA